MKKRWRSTRWCPASLAVTLSVLAACSETPTDTPVGTSPPAAMNAAVEGRENAARAAAKLAMTRGNRGIVWADEVGVPGALKFGQAAARAGGNSRRPQLPVARFGI